MKRVCIKVGLHTTLKDIISEKKMRKVHVGKIGMFCIVSQAFRDFHNCISRKRQNNAEEDESSS